MNKIISTNPHCFVCVVGASGCGKSRLIYDLLTKSPSIFYPAFDYFVYFYQHWQDLYNRLQDDLGNQITFVNEVDFNFIDNLPGNRRHLLVFDDLYDKVAKLQKFVDLVVGGRHNNLHILLVKHNLYQPSQHSRTIDRNMTHLILFKSRRDIRQIDCFGRQMEFRDHLLSAYKDATSEPFGHLLIDFDTNCDINLMFSSRITDPVCSIFYSPNKGTIHVPGTKSSALEIDDEHTESQYTAALHRPQTASKTNISNSL